MPLNKFQKIAKKVAAENPELFESLMDFERTKRIRSKARLNFTVDRDVASKFKKVCRAKGYNMSAKIERAMELIVKDGDI